RIARGRRENCIGDADQTDAGRIFHAPGRERSRAGGGDRGVREMMRVAAVAWNTFREAVRDRVLYNLVFFALLMMASAIFMGQISLEIETIVIVTVGLSAVSVIGLLIAVFTGVGLVSKEMDKRTLYALLSKPVRRWEFLIGKFCGLALTLAVNTAAMAGGGMLGVGYVKRTLGRGRRNGAGRSLSYFVEDTNRDFAGATFFLLYVATAFDSFHGRFVRSGIVRDRDAESEREQAGSGYTEVFHVDFVRAAEFREFQRDGCGCTWTRHSRCTDFAEYGLRDLVLRHRAFRGGGSFFAPQFKVK